MAPFASARSEELELRVVQLEAEVARLRARRLREDENEARLASALTEREAVFAEVERLAQVGSWFWDTRTNQVAWSPELYRILGYDPQVPATVEAFFAAIHPEDRAMVRARSEYMSNTGLTEPRVPCRVLRSDGSVRHIVLVGSAILNARGELARYVGAALDVTTFVDQQAELKRKARLLDEAHRVAGIGSWIWHRAEGVFEWSETMTPILGVQSSHGDMADLLACVHPEDRPALEATAAAIIQGIAPPPCSFRVVRADGCVRYLILNAKLDEDSSTGNLIGTVQDVTSRWELEQTVRHAQKMEAIGRLAGGIAHDFNNYLVVIRGNLDLLQTGKDEPTYGDILEEIARATDRCATLTRQLLAFAHRHPSVAQLIDVGRILNESSGMLKRMLGPSIALSVRAQSTDARILADPSQIELVIVNLAVNARDAMPNGGTIEIDVSTTYLDADFQSPASRKAAGDYVVLSVADTGTGISDAVRERMFEPFFTTKATGHGTGLGLATVYGIVQQSNGYIEVESSPGSGTKFHVYFPARRATPLIERTANVSTDKTASETVLLVEDEPGVRRLTRRLLEREGYRVLEAEDGIAALQVASHAPHINLLLTDLNMPRLDGIGLARRIRATDPSIQILMVTGYSDYAARGMPEDLKGCPILSKPFTRDRLLEKVRSLLRKQPPNRAETPSL